MIFWIKEAFKLIGRAKSSFFFSLVSMSISVLLIAASLISIELSNEFQTRIKTSVGINIFLQDSLSADGIKQVKSKLRETGYINTVKYIDKEQAAKNFVAETGEDFRKILDYNPLPSSFLITLKDKYVEKNSLNKIVAAFSKIPGVNDVVFQQDFVYKLLEYITSIRKYIFAATAVLFLISLYIVYSTVKLILTSKYEELETMKLVGARLSTIKMPIVINALLIGLLAGIISLGVFAFLIYHFGSIFYLRKFIHLGNGIFPAVILLIGPVIGLLVSVFSLRKISLKI